MRALTRSFWLSVLPSTPLTPIRKLLLRLGKFVDRLRGAPTGMRLEVLGNLSAEEKNELLSRAHYFQPNMPIDSADWTARKWITAQPCLMMGLSRRQAGPVLRMFSNVYFIDWRIDSNDGAEWCRLANHGQEEELQQACRTAEIRFLQTVERLRALNLGRAYVFGTGPSLARAGTRDWTDGYRVVCNTIVRDRQLWHHLQPHFVSAGDAVYHFGANRHSGQFLADLDQRLAESPETMFVYPAPFHGVVVRALGQRLLQLIPMRIGQENDPTINLAQSFRLPQLGNVLNLLLLPLACTLSRDIGLWGFDGRDPRARDFWSNSGRHSYPDLMPELRSKHPAFFLSAVPAEDPGRYVRAVHGDHLDQALRSAEQRGFRFEMLHPSWTPTLNRRYRGRESIESYFNALTEPVAE